MKNTTDFFKQLGEGEYSKLCFVYKCVLKLYHDENHYNDDEWYRNDLYED